MGQEYTLKRFSGLGGKLGKMLALIAVCSLIGGMWGCETDSFMDPSVLGRWEMTPTTMPVLDRLSAIEDEPADFVQTSNVQPSDLIPEVEQYRFGPGDQITVHIRDFFTVGVEEAFDRTVDQRGYVDIPRLPPVRAQGRSSADLVGAIENAIREQRINDRPVVSLDIRGQRKQTFSVLGAVRNPGTYFIPSPDYRLLEGLTAAGGSDESLPYIYVIRQVNLSEAASGIPPMVPKPAPMVGQPRLLPQPGAEQPQQPKKSEDLIDLIDELSKQPKGANGAKEKGGTPPPDGQQPAPAILEQPRNDVGIPTNKPSEPVAPKAPAIDLPDTTTPAQGDGTPATPGKAAGWIYVDGQWVKTTPAEGKGESASEKPLVTQRVIKVATGPLLAGAADVNIVLRPGDVVRVPPAKSGIVYMAGQVARPGPYNLPAEGKLTLLRALNAAGGLGGLAIPERVDLTRVVGDNRQATIRVNLRAIAEQTQPDIYLKPDDVINVGTNFFATPLAILRGGLRASYGFGFILDRNFQGDVFGPDRASVSGQ